jgi:hypothetical protein
MKYIFIILLSIALSLPLYAQGTEAASETDALQSESDILNEDGEALAEDDTEEDFELAEARKRTWTRQHFDLGLGIGKVAVGFDNGFTGVTKILKKNVEIDLGAIADKISKNGANINFDLLLSPLYLNIKNREIKGGLWDFGLSVAVDGDVNINFPESLFTLLSEGNINKHSFNGMISASGGVFAGIGISGSAKYDKLRVGFKPVFFAPLVYIPKSGIDFYLDSEDYISVRTSGGISVYSPFTENGAVKIGVDLTIEGEYNLFPFLDVGGSFSQIPFVPATLEKRMRMTMDEFEFEMEDPLTKDIPSVPELGFTNVYDSEKIRALRPMRFDIYARYKPFETEFLVVKPNMGFSVNFAKKKGYFNAGAEAELNLKDLFKVHLGMGAQDAIWKHRLGFVLNLRALEFALEASLRSQSFTGSFTGQGFGLATGLSFGW